MLVTSLNKRETFPAREPRQATPFDGILAQSRDLICDSLDEAVAGMLDKSEEALSALLDDRPTYAERQLYQETRAVVIAQRDILEKQFRRSYRAEFQQRCDRAAKIGEAPGEADFSSDLLQLVGNDDLEEALKFNAMAAKLRLYCDEELGALDQRIGVLLGDANLHSNDNPFSPQVICDAFKHACQQLDADAGVRRVLLRLFDDHVLDDIRSLYKAVNALLVRNSILPKIRYGISKKGDRTAAGAAGLPPGESPPGSAATDPTGAAPQDIFSLLQSLVRNAQAPGVQAVTADNAASARVAAFAGPPPAGLGQAGAAATILQGTELLNSLTRIQLGDLAGVPGANLALSTGAAGAVNVLHELKSSSVGAGMGQLDQITLDIVAMLFDQLFDDPKVPNGVKGLIGRLQIPVLKVAIADKSFFSTKTHPARRLLDALGAFSLRLPADFGAANPLFARLQDILQELVDGFEHDLEIFGSVREKLQALVAGEDQRIEEETREAARHVEEMENLALARNAAQEELKARIRDRRLPGPVAEFLVQQWLKFLLLVHVKDGKQSAAWTDATEAIEQLIWSAEPKSTLEERRRLAATIPGLLKRLSAGLKTAGIEDEVRVRFFAELMKLHTQALCAPATAGSDPASPVAAAPGKPQAAALHKPAAAPADLQPAAARTGAAPEDPLSLDFTGLIAVRNPYGEGEVRVEALDPADTGAARSRRGAAIGEMLDALSPGAWVEFSGSGESAAPRPLRMIFASPRKTRFLFALDRSGKEVLQFTRAELIGRFRAGEAAVLEEPPDESLFDRILGGLVGRLRAPGTRP